MLCLFVKGFPLAFKPKDMKISLFIFLLCLSALTACDEDRGKEHVFTFHGKALGLDGKTVRQMQIGNGKLYVASRQGLYLKPLNGGEFSLIGFEDKDVQALCLLDADDILVSTYDRSMQEAPSLYRSTDGGDTWSPIFFGDSDPEPALDIFIDMADNDTWYVSGLGVVARTEDAGANWTKLYGNWAELATGISVVAMNPHRNELWAGGQGSIENGFLLRSVNGGPWDRWDDLADNPTVVKEITFSESRP